ncbi:SUMF1/EgtB/PvdO family nonheme iron enzyme [Polyangium sp. y55x31]|uniref:SUMF1/EgtB/PvdO family nonheme iron enzyme n=1 Tax=Polyangium sp. y55x31 TaxID=3042688 RepID=UPI002482240B|nr:SUMF1/EgtB/PvdO family nonheme iron enzyme [Polyangium sp. y55x31]MDI1477300.1 SUMF1/EgtB/PvdO family nonheme iron enzyme [Polyangium sp. y55x31]
MNALDTEWLLSADRVLPSAAELLTLAANLTAKGELEKAAIACDAACSVAPDDPDIASARALLLDRLRIVEHGLVFRYVPAGPFLMGAEDGDPDERPVHAVELDPFWITEVPITWSAYHALVGWPPPPAGLPQHKPMRDPKTGKFDDELFSLYNDHKIRRQYCESETIRACDWHAHAPEQAWRSGRSGEHVATSRELFGEVPRTDPARPWTYDQKPMVAVSWAQANALGKALSNDRVTYRLPTEAEWEKAARGGRVGCRYPWGDDPPTPELCDFGRFEAFSIRPPQGFPPNGYGLHGMSGGVREWTADGYDAAYYAESPRARPTGPATATQRVLRGGSWADCAWAVRVSFRMGLPPEKASDPTIGFRLLRTVRGTTRR